MHRFLCVGQNDTKLRRRKEAARLPWNTAAAFTQPERGRAVGRSEDVGPNRSVQPPPPREAEASQLSTLKLRFAVVYQKQL